MLWGIPTRDSIRVSCSVWTFNLSPSGRGGQAGEERQSMHMALGTSSTGVDLTIMLVGGAPNRFQATPNLQAGVASQGRWKTYWWPAGNTGLQSLYDIFPCSLLALSTKKASDLQSLRRSFAVISRSSSPIATAASHREMEPYGRIQHSKALREPHKRLGLQPTTC